MSFAAGRRMLATLAVASAVSSCGGDSSPTAPDMPTAVIGTGPQVLRIVLNGPCPPFEGRLFAPLIYTRVTVTHAGNEWIARATAPDGGDVELRIRQSGPSLVAGSIPVQGTIKGGANHSLDLFAGPSAWAARAHFGMDGGTVLEGFAFSAGSLTPTPGVNGFGTGTITMTDSGGRSCTGSTFLWTLAAPP